MYRRDDYSKQLIQRTCRQRCIKTHLILYNATELKERLRRHSKTFTSNYLLQILEPHWIIGHSLPASSAACQLLSLTSNVSLSNFSFSPHVFSTGTLVRSVNQTARCSQPRSTSFVALQTCVGTSPFPLSGQRRPPPGGFWVNTTHFREGR